MADILSTGRPRSGGIIVATAVAAWHRRARGADVRVELALSGTSPLGIALPAMVESCLIGIGEAIITLNRELHF